MAETKAKKYKCEHFTSDFEKYEEVLKRLQAQMSVVVSAEDKSRLVQLIDKLAKKVYKSNI